MIPRQRFPAGQVVITAGVHALADAQLDFRHAAAVVALVGRHLRGDWGNVPPEDAQANERAVRDGDRILSSYVFRNREVWIVTEADRSVTTVLLPEEY